MRFDHVKFAVRDISRLLDFYRDAFGCSILLERFESDDPDLIEAIGAETGSGWLMALLELPGENRSRLELYTVTGKGAAAWPFAPGQGQISIEVGDVDGAAARVVAAGGSKLGEASDWCGPSGRVARLVFMRDPEGNLVDLYGSAS